MHSLAVKLALAFLLVGLVGAILMPAVLRLLTQVQFEQFMLNRDQSSYVTLLAEYYQATGSWRGVETVFVGPPALVSQVATGYASGWRGVEAENGPQWLPPPPQPDGPGALLLLDADGRKVFSRVGVGSIDPLLQEGQPSGVPIEVGGKTVGQLILEPFRPQPAPGSPEARFLLGINRATTLGALGAAAIALLLGILLARTLTRPIRELTAATQALAMGKLGEQVAVRAHDELGQLVAAFNRMSTELAQAGALRRQMTADIAHELRNPLSIILGYTESLSDGKLPATQHTFDILHEEAQHLSRLIDDLRVLSLAEAGELPLTRQPIDSCTLLERVVLAHTPEAQQRGISMHVEAQPHLPVIEVDTGRMAQVLDNLVSNALRHTASGGRIVLSAEGQGNSVCLRVADNGSGIAPEDLPYVFDRFYRGDKSRRRTESESGLGLAIAKSIVEAQDGSISVASTLGQGTTFTIVLPVEQADRVHPPGGVSGVASL
jgi:two-component system sensor histidine kinase BaeS